MRILQRDEFTKWLREKKPTEFVGRTQAPNTCPIATFLREHVEHHSVLVAYFTYRIEDHDYNLPEWAATFVREIDRKPAKRLSKITAARALKTLRRC